MPIAGLPIYLHEHNILFCNKVSLFDIPFDAIRLLFWAGRMDGRTEETAAESIYISQISFDRQREEGRVFI